MMPGETHSKAAGLGAEATGPGCQNCGALQQNLNEYVGALLALKQKIIETDHLLTKYQQKCDELQVTERENKTLRHQLEQMLQKISSHDHFQGELESLQAQLEEKKSSLKIYQQIQEEYISLKEECAKSDAGKKKLEARVKKLEDAAAKQSSNIKQMKIEKKGLAKELKMTQEKLEGFKKPQTKKKMKHAVTQSTSEEPLVMVDKEKIKRLLEELWGCFDSAAQDKKNKDDQPILVEPVPTNKVTRKRRKYRKSADYISPPSHSSLLEPSEMQSSTTLMEIDNESEEATEKRRSKSFEDGVLDGDSAFYEDRTTDICVPKEFACSILHCSDQNNDDEEEELGEKLHDVLKWARPLPPLLSPVQLSPSCTQDALFGEITDSSDGETDYSTAKVESFSEDGASESRSNVDFVAGKEIHSKSRAAETLQDEDMNHELNNTMVRPVASVLEDAETKQMEEASILTGYLSTNLNNVKMSIEPMGTQGVVDTSEKTVATEYQSKLDNELMQIEETASLAKNMFIQSKHSQDKNNELMLFQEKPCVLVLSQKMTSAKEATSTSPEHVSEQFKIPEESNEATCATNNSLGNLGCCHVKSEDVVNTTSEIVPDHNCLTEHFCNEHTFESTAGAVKDSLITSEQSQLQHTDKTCTSLKTNFSSKVSGKLAPTEENILTESVLATELEEIPSKPKLSQYTQMNLNTANVVLDTGKDTRTIAPLQDNSLVVGTETESKLVYTDVKDSRCYFEHSYSCLVTDSKNNTECQKCEHEIDKETLKELDSQKDETGNIRSTKITANKVQHSKAMSAKAMESNKHVISDTGVKVTPAICITSVSKPGLSEENTTDDPETNKASDKPGEHNLESPFEKCPLPEFEMNSKPALHNNRTETVIVDVSAVHIRQAKYVEQVGGANNAAIGRSVESEQKCVHEMDNISMISENNLDTCKLAKSQVCIISDLNSSVSQTESDFSFVISRTNKLVSSEMESTTEKGTEPFESIKVNIENCRPHTENDAVCNENVKENCTAAESCQNYQADKVKCIQRTSRLADTCNADNCISDVSAPEKRVVNAKELANHFAQCNKSASGVDHGPISPQFATEADDKYDKKSYSCNPMRGNSELSSESTHNVISHSVDVTPIRQQCRSSVILEVDSSAKCMSRCLDVEAGDGLNTLTTHIVPSIGQQVEDAGFENSTEKVQPLSVGSEVKTANVVAPPTVIQETHVGKHSIMMPENKKQFLISDPNVSDRSILSSCSGVLQQVTNPLEDKIGGPVSVTVSLKGSETMKNTIKKRTAEEPADNQKHPNVSNIGTPEKLVEKQIHVNTFSLRTAAIIKEVKHSDLEVDVPIRKVSNANRRTCSLSLTNEESNLNYMGKVTQAIDATTTKIQKDFKILSSTNSHDSAAPTLLKVTSPSHLASSPEKRKTPMSNLLQTDQKRDQKAVCSLMGSSAALSNVIECTPEAEEKELVNVDKSVVLQSVKVHITPSGRALKNSTELSTSEDDSLNDQLLAENIHEGSALAVIHNEPAVSLNTSDKVLEIKNETNDVSRKEKTIEIQAVSESSSTQPTYCEEFEEKVVDPVKRKMEKSLSSSSDEVFNIETKQDTVHTNRKKAAPGRNLIWNLPVNYFMPDPRATTHEHNYAFEREHKNLGLVSFRDGGSTINANNGSNKIQEVSDTLPNNSGAAISEARTSQSVLRVPRVRGKITLHTAESQPILANADTSTITKHSPDNISKVRSEMGPPLPPLLQPLIATPPRILRPVSPIMSSSSRSSMPSPLDDLISPLRETPVPSLISPLPDDLRYKALFTTPSPSETSSRRILSSPLQFCAATPKHAVPVPGRLPPSAPGNAPPVMPQENSVKILDSMYPELSAQARTLNILKGNIQLNRCSPADCKHLPGTVSQITGFKEITSDSTAFVKTVKSSKSDSEGVSQRDLENYQPSGDSVAPSGKRTIVIEAMPRSAKRLRLGNESPNPDIDIETCSNKELYASEPISDTCIQKNQFENDSPKLPSCVQNISDPSEEAVNNALKKIGDSCFDLLPVIRSHVHVGNMSKVPVMRDEEKEVVYEYTVNNRLLAEPLLLAIVKKLKAEVVSMDRNYLHALCRVYVGICRQLGDLERARLFCFSILKEDFPESDKITLFIISVWQDIFSLQGVICKAMQSLVKHRAKGEVLVCLSAYLKWDKGSPLNVGIVLSSVLMAIQLCPNMKFQLNQKYGEDLSDGIWEYVSAVDLLCCHRKWVWTHDNVISKELWPIMDKWVKHRKGHVNVTSTPDIIVAAVLRLIGRLGQIGLKEGFVSAVKNISSVIGAFIQHAKEEDMPWGVQLASVYTLCDLASSDPAGILETLQSWRRTASDIIPPAVSSSIAEITSLCML